MRGNTLGALIIMLRRELAIAESPALARNVRDSHVHALQSAQERLFQAYDWPFKKISREEDLVAGERYYQLHTDMDLENLRKVETLLGSQWQPVMRGIGSEHYNQCNSDLDIRQDPVRRWDFYNDPDTNGDMLEFWPIPASNLVKGVRYFGLKKLKPLVMDADKAEIDDYAIVLSTAADLSNPKDRGARQAKADRHIFSLVRNLSNTATFVSGGGCDPNSERYEPPPIVISQ